MQGKDGHDQTDLFVKPENVATDRSKVELEDLDLILREREGVAGLDMWSILVAQSE